MKCKYYIKDLVFDSILELDNYLMNSKQLDFDKDIIFSSNFKSPTQELAKKKIIEISKEAKDIKNKKKIIEKIVYGEDGEEHIIYKKPYIGVNKYLSGKTNIDGKLFFPEFTDAYWENRRFDWEKGEFTEDELFILQGSKTPLIDEESKKSLEEKIKKKWTVQGKTGTAFHYIMQEFLTYDRKHKIRGLDPDFKNNLINKIKNNSEYNTYLTDKMIEQSIQIASNVYLDIITEFPNCEIFTEVDMTSEVKDNEYQYLYGIADIVVVHEGEIHIFDFKTSTKDYDKYSSAKKRAFQHQIYTYQRMLKNHGLMVSTKNNGLSIIPIIMEGLNYDPEKNNFSFDSVKIGDKKKVDLGNIIQNDSSISTNIDEILPDKYVTKFTSDDILKKHSETLKIFFPNSNWNDIPTDDEIIEEIKEHGGIQKTPEGGYYFKFEGAITKEFIGKDEKEVFNKFKNFKTRAIKTRDNKTKVIRNILESKIKNPDEEVDRLKMSDELLEGASSDWINIKLSKYFNQGYEILDTPALDFGVIVLRHKITGMLNVIKVSSNNLKRQMNLRDKYTHKKKGVLLTAVHQPDSVEKSQSNNKMLEGVYGNAELMETMILLQSMPQMKGQVIASIDIVNPTYGGLTAPNKQLQYCFNKLCNLTNIETKFGTDIKFASNLEILNGELERILSDNTIQSSSVRSCSIDNIKENGEKTLSELNSLRIKLENEFPKLKLVKSELKSESQDPILFLYYKVLWAISELKGYEFKQKIDKAANYFKGFDLNGVMINNPGQFDDELMNDVTGIINKAYQNITDDMNRHTANVRNLMKNLKKENSTFINSGNNTYLFSNMIEVRGEDIYLKNPYDDSVNLTNSERDFLKYFLDVINSNRLKLTEVDKQKMIKENDVRFFRLPYMRASTASKLETQGYQESLKNFIEDIKPKKWVNDMLSIFNKNKKYSEEKLDTELFNINNNFDNGEISSTREEIIKKVGTNGFEQNLEILLFNHINAYSSYEHINDIMPIIKSFQAYIINEGFSQNTEYKVETDYVEKFVKNKIKNQNISDPTIKGAEKHIKKVQVLQSALALAFSPVSFSYQIVDGMWKGIKMMLYKHDFMGFDRKSYFDAWTHTMTGLVNYSGKPDVNTLLNEHYRLNDMDTNQLSEKLQEGNKGFFKFLPMLFRLSSRPDYYNRVTIFQAQMRHDGSYDAYSAVDGKLIYDWKKDKRFNLYANNNTSDLEEYNKQKGLYLAIAKQMVNEGTKNPDGSLFKIGDALPRAYSVKQLESMKSFADNMYGFYTHEKKAMIQSTLIGSLWLQMRTYWTGKKNYLFQKGGYYIRGNYEQYEENGQKWYIDSDGNPTKENTGVPFMQWKGEWQEGILASGYSFFLKLKDNNWNMKQTIDELKLNPDRWKKMKLNSGYMIYDFGLFLIVGALISGALREWAREKKLIASYSGDIDDAIIATLSGFTSRVISSSALDLNLVDSFTDPIMNPGAFAFGITKLPKHAYESMFGDKDWVDFVTNVVYPTRIYKPVLRVISPEETE